jgi:hypothetical protein
MATEIRLVRTTHDVILTRGGDRGREHLVVSMVTRLERELRPGWTRTLAYGVYQLAGCSLFEDPSGGVNLWMGGVCFGFTDAEVVEVVKLTGLVVEAAAT